MYTAFFIGNIGAGKSTATRYLERAGARRIDLDELARGLYVPGSPLVEDIAAAFGADVVDEEGSVRRAVLAERAFCSSEASQRLNALVYPALLDELTRLLLPSTCFPAGAAAVALTVVEVSNAASFTEAFGLADEVVAVSVPEDLRRERACGRGMATADFDARAAVQPTDAELCALADTVLDNSGADAALFAALDRWMAERGIRLEGGPLPGGGRRG